IDFQIEADFAGLMSPGMVNTASEICDKIGHIMNSGDGWYGGVYVAAMYSLAFVSNDIEYVVNEALKAIPAESEFYQCISDVVKWHSKFPNDWKQTWFEVERKWSADIGCPYGVFHNFNIDAKINAAYIVIGLLYGKGDFSKTVENATRCGQDTDCNPASAGGILGTILGYSNIPEAWKKGVYPVEDLDFKYTSMSLNDVYEIGTKHAMQIILKNGGKIDGENITLPSQHIHPVPLEVNFKGHFPVERRVIKATLSVQNPALTIEFSGNGFVLTGGTKKDNSSENIDMQMQMAIDGGTPEPFILPTDYIKRNQDVIWKYQLPKGKHKVEITFKNPKEGYQVNVTDLVVYSSRN
ncbi:MAG: ADP-ribosylglycohydrolase family protein, partial [Bacteroidales bacterium]